MSNKLEFVYFLVTLLVGAFSIGQSSIILIKHPRDRVVRSYIIFMGLITIKLFTWVAYSYLGMFDNPRGVSAIIILTADISILLTIWAIPRFIHSFFKVTFGKWIDYAALVVAALLIIQNLILNYYQGPKPEFLGRTELFSFLSLAIIVYCIVIALLYYRKLEDRIMQKIGLCIGLVSIFFIPAFVIDYLFFQFSMKYTLFTPLFYITWNLFAFYFTIRYYLMRPRNEFSDNPMPTEEFYEAYKISSREREIIPLLLKGLSNRDIADKAFISLSTVKTHIYNIYRKVGVKSRFQLLAKVRDSI